MRGASLAGGRRQPPVSLFPFLSVLLSVIGAFSLIVGGTLVAAELRLGESELLSVLRDRLARLLADARDQEQEATWLEEQAEARRAEARQLEQLTAERAALLEAQVELMREIAEAERRLEELERNRPMPVDGLDEKLAAARQRVAELGESVKQARFELGRSQGDPAQDEEAGGTALVPFGVYGKQELKPVFVDCRRDGIVILPGTKLIATKTIKSSPELERVLGGVSRTKGWCVQLLVREDGVGAFNEIYGQIVRSGMAFNIHPVVSKKDFDVTGWELPPW